MAGGFLSTKKRRKVNEWVNSAQSALWPSTCVMCGHRDPTGRDLCSECAAELPYSRSACRVCGLRLSYAGTCGSCQKSPPAFDRTLATFEYRQPVDRMVQGLKFNGHLYYGRILGMMMAESLLAWMDVRPQCIIPVPLHKQRLRERGFNQAQELARPVARAFHIPIDTGICQRLRATTAQTGLDAKERRKNLRGAFSVVESRGWSHVALVDDVMTTGSTVHALALELKRAGVERVDVWLCARAY